MTPKGVRFPSALLREAFHDDFSRFETTTRTDLHNPWPELIDLNDPRRPWANPWMRLVYLPSTRPESLPSQSVGSHPLSLWVGILHEHVHLALDFTPAKELARAVLGIVYDTIAELVMLLDHGWGQEAAIRWHRLQTLNAVLEEAVLRIGLAEELLATAFSFQAVAHQLSADADRAILAALERRWVAATATEHPGFAELYHGGSDDQGQGFKKVARLLTSPESPFPGGVELALLGVHLETIEADLAGEGFLDRFVASRPRCEALVEAAWSMDDPTQLAAWLIPRAREDQQPWQIALAIAASINQDGNYPQADELWALAHSKPPRRSRWWGKARPLEMARQVQEDYEAWPMPDLAWASVSWSQVLLYPREQHGRWYISPLPVGGQFTEGYGGLLYHEGLRQQLNMRQGFRCPFLSASGACLCAEDRPFKQRLLQLIRAAQQGHLGPGAWEELPPPCGRAT